MSWTITPQTKVPVDPVFNNVSLLLHGNGANGSTTITDSSSSPKTVTVVGNAQISTAQSKFGGSSIAFDGNGDYLELASNTSFGFGTADFTLEGWFFLNNLAGNQVILDMRTTGTEQSTLFYTATTQLLYHVNGSNRISYAGLQANQFYHVAVSKASGLTRMFLDGQQVGSTYSDANDYGTTRPLIIGAIYTKNATYLNGYIDELRITKGVARYTSNFTPPTAPFPDI